LSSILNNNIEINSIAKYLSLKEKSATHSNSNKAIYIYYEKLSFVVVTDF